MVGELKRTKYRPKMAILVSGEGGCAACFDHGGPHGGLFRGLGKPIARTSKDGTRCDSGVRWMAPDGDAQGGRRHYCINNIVLAQGMAHVDRECDDMAQVIRKHRPPNVNSPIPCFT